MPTFCRHNRFKENCPICRDPAPPASAKTRAPRRAAGEGATKVRRSGPAGGSSGSRTINVRRTQRAPDDGWRAALAPGLRGSSDGETFAAELAFSAARLAELAISPPGLYGEIAALPDVEEALWLAFLCAYLGPLDGDDPFSAVHEARVTWAGGDAPRLEGAVRGPRGAHSPSRGTQTVDAYRAWVSRAGLQHAAFAGEAAWTPGRRFERAFERMTFPGMHRAARYDLLVTVGRLGVVDVRASSLRLGVAGTAGDETTIAAKRLLGIGDPILLERRAADLASECDVPLEALDLALFNWGRPGERHAAGAGAAASELADVEPIAAALGL